MPPETRWRWCGLLALALFVSALEIVAALVIVVLLGLFASGTPLNLPVLGELRQLTSQNSPDSVPWIAAVVAVFFLARALIYLTQSYLQNRLAYGTGALLASRLFRGYLAMPYADHLRRNSSEMIRNAHESTVSLAAHVLFPGIVLIAESFVTLALLVVLVLATPSIALTTFALLVGLVLLVLRFVQPRLLRLGRALQTHSAESLKWLQQSLHGLRDIRVLGREAFFEKRFQEIRLDLAAAYGSHGLLVDIPRIALETGVLLALLLFLVAQVSISASFEESFSVLALFGYAAFRMLPSVNRIVNSLQALRFATPIIDLLYEDMQSASAVALPTEAGAAFPLREVIELKDVTYRYPETDRDALHSISLRIGRGELLGVIGRTGSGKSTLLDVILGLLEPTSGSVSVDGQPLIDHESDWHRNLGVVPQTIFLLDDTIERNVAIGIRDAEIDHERVNDALRIAQMADLVSKLPNGLQTEVGERGLRLSGGQRQRLAIARAMYRRPQVLVLDEGLSSLDSQTEAELIDELARTGGDMTIISVAHRASTIRNCDRLIALAEGRILAEGSFDELIRTNEQVAALMRETPGAA